MSALSGAGRRILAVDDELQILRALRLILRARGYEVLTAAGVQDALDRIALSPVDAAIIDLLLPDGDGVALCERIREWSAMPVIVLRRKIEPSSGGRRHYVRTEPGIGYRFDPR